jgi:hypothetical protein
MDFFKKKIDFFKQTHPLSLIFYHVFRQCPCLAWSVFPEGGTTSFQFSNSSFIKAHLQNTQLVLNSYIVQDKYMINKRDMKMVSYNVLVESKNGVKVVY